MRSKVTLALLFLNVALFFFIFYLKSNIAPPQPKGTILGPEVVNLQSIEIVAANRPGTVRLEKRGESWNLTQPVEWPANEHAVASILTELQQLRSQASWTISDLEKNGQSLSVYGLDKPALTVTLTPASAGPGATAAAPSILRIGDTANVGNRLYILSPDGTRVHVVQRTLAESLAIKPEDLRAPEIFSIRVFEVRSLNLQTGAPANSKVRIAQNNSRWMLESPIQARANKSETDITIGRLRALRIHDFVDPRTADALHLTPEEMTLRVTIDGNNRRETLVLGGKVKSAASTATPPTADAAGTPAPASATSNDKTDTSSEGELYYAKMDERPPVFTVAVPAALLKTIATAQESLRDRHILDLNTSAVTEIKVGSAGQSDTTLQRLESTAANPLGAAWQLVRRAGERGPQTLPADREVVDRLLQHLAELSAKDFVADAPTEVELENYGFNRPARTVSISAGQSAATPGSPTPSSVILIGIGGVGADRHVYAKLDKPNYVYSVPDEILAQIPVDPLAYRERLLRDLPAGAKITALKLVDLSTQAVLLDTVLPLPATEAVASAGASTPAPRAAIEKLAAQLRKIRAKRFVHDGFANTVTLAGEERPWRYQLTCTIALVGGSGEQTITSSLFFSERIGGTTQLVGAPDPGFDVVFEAEQPLLDALFAITYGPRDPGPTPPPPEPAPAEPAAK